MWILNNMLCYSIMGKSYKKKTNRKKPTCGGKKKKFSRRKMKGGVAFNTSFSSSSLPSSTYIPLNQNVNANPSWDQISSRLLPEMKGGKRTRKNIKLRKSRKRRRRKMKGGSLIGTDVVTGLNTTGTNSALAFGTSGGTNYMLDTLTAKEINSGDYMSPDLRAIPIV
jgi:hypothetical protein